MIVFLDAATMDDPGVDLSRLRKLGEYQQFPVTGPDETAGRCSGAGVVITNKTFVGDLAMEASPGLKLICVCATGVNNIDLAAAERRGIVVCNVSGYGAASVAQHAITLLLNLATNVHRYDAEKPLWPESPIFTRTDHPVVELAGKTLGIAGLGAIGRATATIARSLGMDVLGLARAGSAASPFPRADRATFFRQCDAVSLHCPLTPETEHMVNAETLAVMKPSAFLVNTSRGQLVDEPALAEALKSGAIAGAAVDVLSVEPPPADHPLLDPSVPNLIVTPHTAWVSTESRQRLFDGVVKNIEAFLAGVPTNRVV